MKDELYGTLVEPNFYSALKESGYPSARYRSGKYKDERAHLMWIAYLCGKWQNRGAQHFMDQYPSDEDEPHES